MSDVNDDALSWAGDEDRLSSQDTPGQARAATRPAPSANEAVQTDQATSGMSSFELIVTGVIAGIYLLFSVAWLITALSNPTQIADPLGNVMYVAGLWLAVFAPATWFAAVLFFSRGKSVAMRMSLFALGIIVFIPWPYISWAGV